MSPSNGPSKINLSLDIKQLIIGLLVIIIAVMLILWKPWSNNPTDADRTVRVTGEATLKAEPDEFVFRPNYQFKNVNKDAALAELTKKSNEIIAKLKELGVPDSKIKTNSNGYNYSYYRDTNNLSNYTLSLTITATSKEQAQTVQDYLVTTQPLGSVSPQASFSDAKRKELESKARDEATKDARAKADQSARNLGFKIAKVKSVDDGNGFGAVPYYSPNLAVDGSAASPEMAKLSVQPGENDINYSVTVVYFVR